MTPMARISRPIQKHQTSDGDIFVSTVTGACLPGTRLDAGYWWKQRARSGAVRRCGAHRRALGSRYFVEIVAQNAVETYQRQSRG